MRSLRSIAAKKSVSAGFLYRREKDAQPDYPDVYIIDYYSEEYSSATERWFDDD